MSRLATRQICHGKVISPDEKPVLTGADDLYDKLKRALRTEIDETAGAARY